MIRECFSTRVLLGSLEDPVLPEEECQPVEVQSDTIMACICTTDLCNGIGNDFLDTRVVPVNKNPQLLTTPLAETPRGQNIPGKNRNKIDREPPSVTKKKLRKKQQTFHPDRVGLQCYACGSLINPNKKCDRFNRTDTDQVQTCLKDEARLMYSWRKSPTEMGKKTRQE